MMTKKEFLRILNKPGKVRGPVIVKNDVIYVTIEKQDVRNILAAFGDDDQSPWEFLPFNEGDTERDFDVNHNFS